METNVQIMENMEDLDLPERSKPKKVLHGLHDLSGLPPCPPWFAFVFVFGFWLLASGFPTRAQQAPKFFADDPIQSYPDTQDASKTTKWDIDLLLDLTINLFGTPGDPAKNVRARSVNTVDEVPDSSWFTNRAGVRPLTAADITRGPDAEDGPAAGTWTVTSAKSDGITPGFTIRDASGTRWFLKFDPPGYPNMATGTEVVVTKLMWALGYFVPENHIATLHPDRLVVADTATVTPPGEPERPMRTSDLAMLLKHAQRGGDGSFRVVASKALPGRPIGGFKFYGTRPDDPNDVIPHEHRRELRGYGTFAAWLNHVDAKAINSLDVVVSDNTRSVVRHYLLDFGSTLGSAAVGPREPWEGTEYMVEPSDVGRRLLTFGLPVKSWRTVDLYESKTIGALPRDNTTFNPDAWKPRVPNQAFLRARADDKFWAATKLAAISDDLIRAAVATGTFNAPEDEQFLVRALIERRDAIVRRYLTAVNPVAVTRLSSDGVLVLRNLAVDAHVAAAPSGYRVEWSEFNNTTRESRRIGESSSAGLEARAPAGLPTPVGSLIHLAISATGGVNPEWSKPVHAYFRRTTGDWILVGFERID